MAFLVPVDFAAVRLGADALLHPRLSPARRLYSWGTCKTPNNSVTAALSQAGLCQILLAAS